MMPRHRKCCLTHRSSNVLGKQLNKLLNISSFPDLKEFRVCHSIASKIKGEIPPLSPQNKRLHDQIEDNNDVDVIDMTGHKNDAPKCMNDDGSHISKVIKNVLGMKP